MEKFLETYNLPWLNQGGIENVSNLITSKEIESAMRTLLTKSPEPYDPAILSILLQILPKEMKSLTQKDLCTPMFISGSLETLKYFNNGWMVKEIMIYINMYYIYTHRVLFSH